MKTKQLSFFLIALCLVLVIPIVSCSPSPTPTPIPTPAPVPTPTPTPTPTKEIKLQMIKEWSGTGTKTTGPFTIAIKPWAIAWANNPTASYGGYLGITVYDISNPNFPIALVANTIERGSDNSYIYETGTFFLEIDVANTKWEVQVWAAQ